MYDWRERRAATDALWRDLSAALTAAGVPAPARLTRGGALAAIWRDPALLVAQTCGYPLVVALRERVRVLAVPHYAVPGCDGPYYSSAVIVRADEPARSPAEMVGGRVAVNAPDSQSGMAALRHLFQPFARAGRAFRAVVATRSHRASVRAVAGCKADIAAIDAVAWHLAQRFEASAARRLRVLAWTAQRPGLPLITAAVRPAEEVDNIRRVLLDRLNAAETAALRRPLFIAGASAACFEDYAPIAAAEAADIAAGYPVLA